MTKSEYINTLKSIALTEPDYERNLYIKNLISQIEKMTEPQFELFNSTMIRVVTHNISTSIN